MPRSYRHPTSDLDSRALEVLRSGHAQVNESAELAALRVCWEPQWERPRRGGEDITDRPELWTPYQRARRESFEERVAKYRADGLL
ncbi:hypothetical protein [Microbacterium deminutum]|uniref:Uncharacterized protein n=1 Tax=Microbacterium deminutum TaxID=344164 RepID=A0ABP5BUM4_9MICO